MVSECRVTYSLIGLRDHRPFIASFHNRNAWEYTEPDGGTRWYRFRQRNRTVGQKQNMIVGSKNDNQKPTYRSA